MIWRIRAPRATVALALALAGAVAAGCSSAASSSTPAPNPMATAQTISVTGKNTDLMLDASTVQALKNVGVQISPVSPATVTSTGAVVPGSATSSGAFSFPVTSGTLTQAGLKGQITHSGGLKFTHSGKTVTATHFVLSTTRGVLSATVNGKSIPLFAVSLAKMIRTPFGDEIVASGITSTITTSAAILLDARLAVKVFSKGLPAGALTAYITGKPA
jgi:hypothetical protein